MPRFDASRWEATLAQMNLLPFAADLIGFERVGNQVRVLVHDDIEDVLSFNPEHITLHVIDGRDRRVKMAVKTGLQTPSACRLVNLLEQGATLSEIRNTVSRYAEVARLWRGLRESGLVEELETKPRPKREIRTLEGDRLRWLGHAFAAMQSGSTSIWADPYLPPKLKWGASDLTRLFSPRHAEAELFEHYDHRAQPLGLRDLPVPQAVFITHQDTDHFDLGSLMRIPESVPIFVPFADSRNRFEVDLASLIRQVLGRGRKVRVLRHFESARVGPFRVTALPFEGEVAPGVSHQWNCYLWETRDSAVLLAADSNLGKSATEFLVRRLGKSGKPLTICSRNPQDSTKFPGYTDEFPELRYSLTRLWPWYAPVIRTFDEIDQAQVTFAQLRLLKRKLRIKYHLSYAAGTAPWFRFTDDREPLHFPVFNPSLALAKRVSKRLKAKSGIATFPGKFGEPVRVS